MGFDKALESVKSIRLTGGIFGKSTLLLIVLTICFSAVTIRIGIWWFAALILLPVLGLTFYTIKRCFDFAEANPQAAIMDGAELLVHERILHGQKGDEELSPVSSALDHEQPPIEISEIEAEDPKPTQSLGHNNSDNAGST